MNFAIADTRTALTGEANGWQGASLRNIIAGAIVQASGPVCRAYFKCGAGGATVDAASINGTAALFAGVAGTVGGAHAILVTDWTPAPIVAGAPVTIQSHFGGTNTTLARSAVPDSNYASAYEVDGQSSYTAGNSENYWFCGLELQMPQVNPVPSIGSRSILVPSRGMDCLAGPVPASVTNPNTQTTYLNDVSRLEWADETMGAGLLVAVGDSITTFADLSQVMPAFNAGVGGERIEGITCRVPKLTALHRAVAVSFMAGINNLNVGQDINAFLALYYAQLDQFSGPLVVTGITQQADTVQQSRIATANAGIAAHMSGRVGAIFVDPNPILAPAGVLLTQYRKVLPITGVLDNTHWSPAGYAVWYSLLRSALSAIL